MALIAHISTLGSRVPFLHFFDGFRTSHEINKALAISDETIRALLDEESVLDSPRRGRSARTTPSCAGTAQNPDVYLPGPRGVQSVLPGLPHDRAECDGPHSPGRLAAAYHLFDYVGAPDAERVIILMGSGAGAVEETINHLNAQGEKLGPAEGSAVPAVCRRCLPGRAAGHGEVDCRAGPHQRAGRAGRTALPGCSDGVQRGVLQRNRAICPAAPDYRRALWPFVEGIHPGDGEGRLRRIEASRVRRTTSPSASTTT